MILARTTSKKKDTLLFLVIAPMWMNFLLRTYAWLTILEKNGIVNKLLSLFDLGPYQLLYNEGAVMLGMVYNYLPFMILPLHSIMTKIDNRLIEAAQDLGAPSRMVFSEVVLPLSVPGRYKSVPFRERQKV